jgi:hypothetical protein
MKPLLASIAALSLSSCAAPGPEAEKPAALAEVTVTSTSPEAIAHFKKGRELLDHARAAESLKEFDAALALDPDFALALAYRGEAALGANGLAQLREAATKSSSLPEAERLLIEAMLALRMGELENGNSC